MSTLSIKTKSNHDDKETFSRLKKVLDEDKDLRKLDSSYQCTFDEAALNGTAKGSKFTAKLNVKDSEVVIEVKLALLLSPFKSMVQSTLLKKVEKALA